jgi:hypothetical protein
VLLQRAEDRRTGACAVLAHLTGDLWPPVTSRRPETFRAYAPQSRAGDLSPLRQLPAGSARLRGNLPRLFRRKQSPEDVPFHIHNPEGRDRDRDIPTTGA